MKRLVLAVILLALLACGEGNQLDQGEVIEKNYDDPDTWTSLYCASYGQNGGCILWLPMTHQDGPHWSLRVVGVDDEGEQRKEWHEVTQTLYETANIGMTVNFPEDRVIPR